ncbi:MAG: DUF4421 family protein [Bacteroidia bacterium]|nr:DUF4421 family protein [Bacteroidia bacterium]
MKHPTILFCLLFNIISHTALADNNRRPKDSTNIYQKIDTNFIESYRDILTAKLIAVVRNNRFSITDKLSQQSIEYGINTNLNMGIGLNFKGIGLELQYNPPGLNNDDHKFGKSTQFSVASSANTRRFIIDAFYRYNQGFHTTKPFLHSNDTIADYYRRGDIKNNNIGVNMMYIFNNKRFSSSAPYSLTQRQKKGAGSLLLGTYFFLYSIDADSIIYPDTLYKSFKPAVQFSNAASTTFGISCGYSYTFVFFKHWFANITTVPGISIQEFYSKNAFTQEVYKRVAPSFSFQYKLSVGFNRKSYFIGISYQENQFVISDDKASSVNYKYGTFKFYYGHRFDLRKLLKKVV